jgi:predicted aldo/keto reductase-like oxidoreductase
LFSLGGQGTIEQEDKHDQSIRIIHRAIDLGVNYIDTAPRYGESQKHIGEVMASRRTEVFLAAKTHDRSRDGSLRLLEESLKTLQTDHLDLWQLHSVGEQEDLDLVFGRDGAIEAFQKARDEKTVRFLGIAGHYDPAILVQGLKRFDFDTILMALNPSDPHHLSFQEELLPLANEKNMGVIAMKIPARGRVFRPDGVTSMKDAMRYVLTKSVSTVIVGCDTLEQLEENVRIAAEFEPMSTEEMTRVEELTKSYWPVASFFKKGGARLPWG